MRFCFPGRHHHRESFTLKVVYKWDQSPWKDSKTRDCCLLRGVNDFAGKAFRVCVAEPVC